MFQVQTINPLHAILLIKKMPQNILNFALQIVIAKWLKALFMFERHTKLHIHHHSILKYLYINLSNKSSYFNSIFSHICYINCHIAKWLKSLFMFEI